MSIPRAILRVPALLRVSGLAWRDGRLHDSYRALPVESAVALTYNGSTHAVMMASPADLEDFAIGFSLAEGIIDAPGDIEDLRPVEGPHGIDLQMWLNPVLAERHAARRRFMAGPTGCGLCGIESLEQAVKPPTAVSAEPRFTPEMIAEALASLPAAQRLNAETRAMHAAGYWEPGIGLVALREDVGRHNALDKLAGALARDEQTAQRGLLLLTSRVSVEMVQKAARLGVAAIVAVSAPTSMALSMATAAGITLIAVARGAEFEVFSRPDRLLPGVSDHVA